METLIYRHDSLIYEIISNYICEEIIKLHINKFDTSNLSPNNRNDFPLINEKFPGLLKDKSGGLLLTFLIGL